MIDQNKIIDSDTNGNADKILKANQNPFIK